MYIKMNTEEQLFQLSEFYKYCLNVCPEFRNDENWAHFHGWCRCKMTPYLNNGKIIDSDKFIEKLAYSLTDYSEFCNCFFTSMNSDELQNKIKNLLIFIENNKNDLVNLIEKHSHLFSSFEDTMHSNKLEEHWNDKAYEKENDNGYDEFMNESFDEDFESENSDGENGDDVHE